MPTQPQLEIISPGGDMEFHVLDPDRGVANIGRHPDNDIVIDSPGVAPFHAVLDHRQRPFQIMLLVEEGETKLRGQRLEANVFKELHNWDTIEIDGYAIILLEGAETDRKPGPAAPREAPVPPPSPVSVPAPLPQMSVPGTLLSDLADDVIITEISAREWTVDVEQTASFQVTVINGGDIVAAFDVRVQGVDESWVTVAPAQFNLNERAQTRVTVSITVPRATSSRAGTHPVAVSVTSPNYPGRLSRMGAILVINPFYEFFVGELSPKQQTVSWFRRSGEVTVPIGNKGNSETPFRLEGDDDERGCRFEFEVPGEEAKLVKQAEVRLEPDESCYVPVQITPIRRRLVGLRSHYYSFTITAAMVESAQTPRSVMGRLKAKPLIGSFLLLLMLVGLVALILFLIRPSSEPALFLDNATPAHEEQVTLTYDASRFPGLNPTHILNRVNSLFLRLVLEYKAGEGEWQVLRSPSELNAPDGLVTDVPLANGRYRLGADNWISQLLPIFAGVSREVPVYVSPVEPVIEEFRSDKGPIWAGEEVTLFWRVVGAETLKIEYNGIEESLTDTELESGSRVFAPDMDTIYTLIAGNSSWPQEVRKPLPIAVLVPTATPIPTPVVVRFDVDPLEITAGEAVRIDWEVTGADSVSIDPIGQGLPIQGNVGDQPTSLTIYELTAYKTADDGTQVQNKPLLKEVIVNPEPSATTAPVAPEVQLFEATPKEIIRGITNTVKLTWSVSGATTDIEITAPDLKISGLREQDVVTVTVKETTLFVLTAYNGELNRSAAAEVTVIEPTPTPTSTPIPTEPPPPTDAPTPTDTPTPTPTPTPFPPPIIRYLKVNPQEGYENKVSFQNSYDSDTGWVYVYSVEAGAFIELEWQVSDAEIVTIEGFGPQGATGKVAIPDPITNASSYFLSAENNGGQNQVMAFVQIEIFSPPAPPPPSNVTGQEDPVAGTNTIAWSYPVQERSRVDYYRIYRADVPPGTDFEPVWPTEDNTPKPFVDNLGPGKTCGKAYYVVAVYTDLVTGAERETAASSTSWYSTSCP